MQNQMQNQMQDQYYPFAFFTMETASVIISANSVIGFGIDDDDESMDDQIVWADDWTIELVLWNLSIEYQRYVNFEYRGKNVICDRNNYIVYGKASFHLDDLGIDSGLRQIIHFVRNFDPTRYDR